MMHKSTLAVWLLFLFFGGSVVAGTVTIEIDPNKSMYFATIRNDHSIESDYITDSDGDGKIQVTIADQETVREYWVTKPLNGRLVRSRILSSAALLQLLEPFLAPFFEPTDPNRALFIEYDVDATVDFGSLFEAGDALSANAGSIAETSRIIFRDASGLPDTLDATLYDPSLLPLFTGDLRVTASDAYDPPLVPAPASVGLGLLGMGLVGLLRYVRSRENVA